jgi:arylsulfatase A-like enzyme
MRAIMVMYDTLCRRYLPPYGNQRVIGPNFLRLAGRSVQFQNCYVGSMPCMPARREIHTGRYNFLHRGWGPLEPFDDSMPETLKRSGVHCHKVTDHYHYWEDGGATYHNRFSTYEFVRGQEGDAWIGQAGPRTLPEHWKNPQSRWQDWVNRQHMRRESDQPQTITFDKGIEYIRRNAGHDRWFLQIETFDPHEPFFTQRHYQDLYPHDWDEGQLFDWPSYERNRHDARTTEHLRCMFSALVTMCDRNLGRILDLMDELDLWKDTLLIVNTDHGFMMGEHDWWAKCRMPFWQEVAHIPLWIWDPRSGKRGERRNSLVQTVDLAPTLLEFFGLPLSEHAQGRPLRATVENDAPVREAGLYGMFGAHVNLTDGRHVYMRAPTDVTQPLFEYTLMPMYANNLIPVETMRGWRPHEGFPFARGCPLMRIPARQNWVDPAEMVTRLYDLENDYDQQRPLADAALERRMVDQLIDLMRATQAPPEQFVRLGLEAVVRRTERAIPARAR